MSSEKRVIENAEKSIGAHKRKKTTGPPHEVEFTDNVKGDEHVEKEKKIQLTYTLKVTDVIAKYFFWLVMCPFVCGLMGMVLHPASVSMEMAYIFAFLVSAACLLILGFVILTVVFGFEIFLFAISVPDVQPQQDQK
jgi:hypothetical protein